MIRNRRHGRRIILRCRPAAPLLIVLAILCTGCPRTALADDPASIHHHLRVRLYPETHRLVGADTITFYPATDGPLEIRLAASAEISHVSLDGKPVPHRFRDGRLTLDGRIDSDTATLDIRYSAVFNDPVPVLPANTDNPGYGVSGTISEKGVFLLAGAGWYPRITSARKTYRVEVSAPEGIVAVTAGRSVGHDTRNGETVSVWEVHHPVRGLSLSALNYTVKEKRAGRIVAAAYLLPQSTYMADKYLDATIRYIRLYEKLFGPYPFDKFAVVENFFPTGFGFPSYTLMGSRVLRLPFIVHTSYGHEIAHCWWGNGVYVDHQSGNWCEGLTSYVADYLYKERRSAEAALDHRRQWLRNYATLVRHDAEFPLSRFVRRYDNVSKVVGYDKAAMLFHMLRRRVGDANFWAALRDLYRDRLFRNTGWEDIRAIFERRAGVPLKGFFHQWVSRPGALQMSLDNVALGSEGGEWQVSGRILQREPFFETDVDVVVTAGRFSGSTSVALQGRTTPFRVVAPARPDLVAVDPDYHVFRKLYRSEVPPTVNTLKASKSLLLVTAENATPRVAASAAVLLRALGVAPIARIHAQKVTKARLSGNDLLFIGMPKVARLVENAPDAVRLGDDRFVLNGNAFSEPGDLFFGVFAHPFSEGRIAAVFLPVSGGEIETAARKITHYGRYSYLAFRKGQNREKGTWPITRSPLMKRFGDP